MRARLAHVVSFTLLAAIAAAFWFASREKLAPRPLLNPESSGAPENSPPELEDSRRSSIIAPKQQIVADRPAVTALPPPPEIERSHLADDLHAPNRTGSEDMSVVMNLFTHYRTRFHGYPVGEDNATFVNALSGNNPGRLAFISHDHPAIDAQGQLLDRWGKPYFFHLLGHDALEIRSAGPDRELYTPDDFIAASPTAHEPDGLADER
jgi:hypothetical protein